MRIVIAPNSFKGSLSCGAAARAIARGARAACPAALIEQFPFADGGDGTLEAVSARRPGAMVESACQDALGRPVRAAWFKYDDQALLESAQACGMARLSLPAELQPLQTSTAGVGLLIRAALEHGFRNITIGLGGSATVDAGCGMAQALGFGLLDHNNHPIPPGGGGLRHLRRIETSSADPRLRDAAFTILADVANPLLGSNGAARVFGPQKGATPNEVEILESNLANWARVARRDLGWNMAHAPAAGAAGGMGAGCMAFLKATVRSGAEHIAQLAGLDQAVVRADLIVTGEGRIDSQTVYGKGPAQIARLAAKFRKPVLALGGSIEAGFDAAKHGFWRCATIAPAGTSQAESMTKAAIWLEQCARDMITKFLTEQNEQSQKNFICRIF